jgi:hypothetical protein
MRITIKRMEGTPAQLSDFKKGKRFDTLESAEQELSRMAKTAPASGHKVAWEIEGYPTQSGYSGAVYGSLTLLPSDAASDDTLRRSVVELYYGVTL